MGASDFGIMDSTYWSFSFNYFVLTYIDISTAEDTVSLAGSSANTHCYECAQLEVLMSSLEIGMAMKNSPWGHVYCPWWFFFLSPCPLFITVLLRCLGYYKDTNSLCTSLLV